MVIPSMIAADTNAATNKIKAALANGSAIPRPLAPCRLPPAVEAALAGAPECKGAVRPRVPGPCPVVTEATKAIFCFPGIQAALDRLASEQAAKTCVGTLVKTAIESVVAQAEARKCVAKMVQAAVDSVMAGSASKVAIYDATEVLDIEEACVSDEDVGADHEVDALCELLVVECCDDFAEEFLADADAGGDGAAASYVLSEGNPSINIGDQHATGIQESSTDAVEVTVSINDEAACTADLDTGAADECNSKERLDMPEDLTEAGLSPRRRSLAGQVSDFPLSSEADVFLAEVVVPAARHGDSATSHVGAANVQDSSVKQHSSRKKGGAGKKRSKAARQGKKGKHAKKGKKGRA